MDSGEPKTVPPPRPPGEAQPSSRAWLSGLLVLVYLFIFLVGIRGLGQGFQGLGEDLLDKFFHATKNPFTGLVIGILGTTLV
ncbi:MAG TPA: hypothetical protein PKD61_09905, partial [Polyangiaceae bacterium]|nr:hypothetical protein [Polyangiaceae bacterium]